VVGRKIGLERGKKEEEENKTKQKTKISNSMKIHPVEAEMFHADELMERHDEANNCFLQFCKCV
jgi:hypothetical protein